MREKNVMFFTEKEEEFTQLLIEIGIQKNVAKVLVFLANVPETDSRAIERGTDLRQPEVSIAMRQLKERDWVRVRKMNGTGKGRPVNTYGLARPIADIVDGIEKEKRYNVTRQLQWIQKLRDYA